MIADASRTSIARLPATLRMLVDRRIGGSVSYLLTDEEAQMQVPDEIRKCVGYVGVVTSPGSAPVPGGTFFLVSVPVGPHRAFLYAVTAAHVIDGVERDGRDLNVHLLVNLWTGGVAWLSSRVLDWRFHPTKAGVDAAVLPLNPAILAAADLLSVPITMAATPDVLASRGLSHGDEVFYTGLFTKHVPDTRNIPIVRVGTVDQAMLAALQVKHAHLRLAALARSFLVIDEVHASDRYMNEVQNHLLKIHLKRGGHAMLMSATLGSVARSQWLGKKKGPSLDEAVAAPYPAVWRKGSAEPLCSDGSQPQKAVAMGLVPTMAAEEAAQRAIFAARAGARALVVRNTVTAAVATFEAVRAAGEAELLLQVGGGPALHHSRFAPEDRERLDKAVEAALAANPRRQVAGLIVIGTQTLEQSLDIDADYLLTDLCPVDVLLQRIGRLHRHRLPRPTDFDAPRCDVLSPERGLEALLAPAFENGIGAWRDASGALQGVYRDLSILELTRRLVESEPTWLIPQMNRRLVEGATHPDRIHALHSELGKRWADYWNNVVGGQMADAGMARQVLLRVDESFSQSQFPSDEETIRTRLGAEGARIEFAESAPGPFGVAVSGVTLPAHWSHGVDVRERVAAISADGVIRFRIENAAFAYSRAGLAREKAQ